MAASGGFKDANSLKAEVMIDTQPNSEASEELNSSPPFSDLSSSESSACDASFRKQQDENKRQGCSARWTTLIKTANKPIMISLQALSRVSARNPTSTIVAAVAASILLLVIGLFTNFNLFVDEDVMWTPANSYPRMHSQWITEESGFPKDSRLLVMFFHAGGDNVLGKDQVSRVFEAVDAVRNMDGYDEVCKDSSNAMANSATACGFFGVIRFWNVSTSLYNDSVTSDTEAIADMSKMIFPDGTPVVDNRVFGYPERDPDTGLLTSVQSYSVVVSLPPTERAQKWELTAVHAVLALNEQWAADAASLGRTLQVQVQAEGSFGDELTRAIEGI